MAGEQRSSKPPEPEISIPNGAELVKKILAVNTYDMLACWALYIHDDISSHFSFKGQTIREVENLTHGVLNSLPHWSSGNFGTCPMLRWVACLTVLNILAVSLCPLKGTCGPWTCPIWGSAQGQTHTWVDWAVPHQVLTWGPLGVWGCIQSIFPPDCHKCLFLLLRLYFFDLRM